jgi:hypothetical protein
MCPFDEITCDKIEAQRGWHLLLSFVTRIYSRSDFSEEVLGEFGKLE